MDARRSRDKLIEAYLELVGTLRAEPRMDDVAATAGIARVTLYRHFTDRDGLRRAALVHLLDEADELMRDALGRPSVEQALDTLVRGALERMGLMHVIYTGEDNFDREVSRRWAAWTRPLLEFARAAQARGELRADVPAEWLVDLLFWSVQALSGAHWAPSGHDPAQLILTTFLDGARTRSP